MNWAFNLMNRTEKEQGLIIYYLTSFTALRPLLYQLELEQ